MIQEIVVTDILAAVRRLTDDELVLRLKGLSSHERTTMGEVVAHLAELDTRDLHLRAGYGSLFVYCRDALRLSESEAYNRIEAARAARRFPVILELLEEGSINLTTVKLLARHLTPENHREVLESARGKRKAQVEEIMVGLWPQPDVASMVRKLPAPRPGGPIAVGTTTVVGMAPSMASAEVSPPVGAAGSTPPVLPTSVGPQPAHTTGVAPLSPDRYKVQFTIGAQTLEKLRLARDMLRHAIPSGDEASILDRALTVLLADLARRKFAATDRPRAGSDPAPGSRHVPAEVRRSVWQRDLGRCAFMSADGRRCGERGMLEFHHVEPYAAGGEATVANVELRCRKHNGYEARVVFGPARSFAAGIDSFRNESETAGVRSVAGAARDGPVPDG